MAIDSLKPTLIDRIESAQQNHTFVRLAKTEESATVDGVTK